MQRACACVFVDCWRLEHWCAAFEDIFRFRWFLSCTLIPFSCSLTENLSSDLLFKHYFFIFTRFLLLLFLQVIQMWFCDLSTLCKQRSIWVATALKFWPTLELSSGEDLFIYFLEMCSRNPHTFNFMANKPTDCQLNLNEIIVFIHTVFPWNWFLCGLTGHL